jgi:predicted  nucleic acid-binding Zn-ribbon protein
VFERVREAIDAALGAAASPGELTAAISRMRGAVVEARAAVKLLEQGLDGTSAGLAAERRQLEDAERRGRLAAGIGDRETVDIAQRFAAKHVEKITVLERKLAAQQDELTLARRELAEMVEQLARVEREHQGAAGPAPEPGRVPPDDEEELLRSRMDRAAKDARADQQLEALKRRMGK